MKLRAGFVSNSSTSSFVLEVDPFLCDCYEAKGEQGCDIAAYDCALQLIPSHDFDQFKKRLERYEDQKNLIQYISLSIWNGIEVLKMSSGNIIGHCNSGAQFKLEELPRKSIKLFRWTWDYSDEDQLEYDQIKKAGVQEHLFNGDTDRFISAFKASKVLGPSLVMSEEHDYYLVNGVVVETKSIYEEDI